MEPQPNPIETLVERVGDYGKTTVELYRLKAIDKSSVIVSSMATTFVLFIFFILLFMMLNIGLALWIGGLLGKYYFGFFIVAAFYILVGIILYAFRDQWIKTPLRNSILTQTLECDAKT